MSMIKLDYNVEIDRNTFLSPDVVTADNPMKKNVGPVCQTWRTEEPADTCMLVIDIKMKIDLITMSLV